MNYFWDIISLETPVFMFSLLRSLDKLLPIYKYECIFVQKTGFFQLLHHKSNSQFNHLDIYHSINCRVHHIFCFSVTWDNKTKKSAVIFRQNADFYTENKQTGQLIFSILVSLTKKQKKDSRMNQTYIAKNQ